MSASDRDDCVVIGAGVIGISIARELAMVGRDLIVQCRSSTGYGVDILYFQ